MSVLLAYAFRSSLTLTNPDRVAELWGFLDAAQYASIIAKHGECLRATLVISKAGG